MGTRGLKDLKIKCLKPDKYPTLYDCVKDQTLLYPSGFLLNNWDHLNTLVKESTFTLLGFY